MLEGEYLDMVNHLKSEFDIKDRELKNAKENFLEMVKIFISCYGFIRVIDIVEDASEKEALLEILRMFLSDKFDDFLSMNNINE